MQYYRAEEFSPFIRAGLYHGVCYVEPVSKLLLERRYNRPDGSGTEITIRQPARAYHRGVLHDVSIKLTRPFILDGRDDKADKPLPLRHLYRFEPMLNLDHGEKDDWPSLYGLGTRADPSTLFLVAKKPRKDSMWEDVPFDGVDDLPHPHMLVRSAKD